ncbi:MAG TPA: hypothetical protein VFB36_03895 [Nevskiaceae bacterium]|nr:hypothetical protein [Nevskiaceae bacterium]
MRNAIAEWLWFMSPMGILTLLLTAAILVGCAPAPTRADQASFEARDCVLGVTHGEQVLNREVFRDPVDALITAAIDAPRGSWQCPAGERT